MSSKFSYLLTRGGVCSNLICVVRWLCQGVAKCCSFLCRFKAFNGWEHKQYTGYSDKNNRSTVCYDSRIDLYVFPVYLNFWMLASLFMRWNLIFHTIGTLIDMLFYHVSLIGSRVNQQYEYVLYIDQCYRPVFGSEKYGALQVWKVPRLRSSDLLRSRCAAHYHITFKIHSHK